jgi:ABC-type phosphate transport system permease subunit
MGVATSSNTFFRSLGSVFGTAAFGAILTNRLGHYLTTNIAEVRATNPEVVAAIDPQKLQDIQSNTSIIAELPPQVQSAVLDAVVHSFQMVFLVAAPVVAVGFFVALFLRETPLRTSEDYAAARKESAGEALG